MNSVKNAIVTVTLLAVGYGAYIVLSTPPERDLYQASSPPGLDAAEEAADDPPTVIIEEVATTAPMTSADSPSTPTDHSVAPLEGVADSSATSADLVPIDEGPAEPQAPAPLGSSGNGAAPAVANAAELSAVGQPTLREVDGPPTDVSDAPLGDAPPGDTALGQAPPEEAPPLANAMADGQASEILVQNGGPLHPAPERRTAAADTEPPVDVSLGPIPRDGTTSGKDGPFEQAWKAVEQQVRDGDLVRALSSLSSWYHDQTLDDEQHARCLALLDQLAGTVIYSRQHLIEPPYEVQAGETLNEIATRYAVPQELLAKINGIAPPYALATGEKLKVVRGPFRAEISMSSQQLTLFLGSYYAGRFSARIGRDLPPQEAFYEVAEKTLGRSYFDRRIGREVLTGETSNRYGDRWVGLRGDQITAGHSVGIHGRPAEASDGEIGSISLHPVDAEDVFSILSIGSRVHVRR